MAAESSTPPTSFRNRQFLVTGGAGFIGSHVVDRLVDLGARVRVLDDFSTGQYEYLSPHRGAIEIFDGTLSDTAFVRRAVAGAEYVLHLAAIVSIQETIDNPQRNFDVNLAGTHQLLIAARDAGVNRFVFSSTCAIYGDHPAPHHEALVPRARSPYGAAKAGAEQLCRAFSAVYGLPTICLRYFNVYGPRQNPRDGYGAAIPRFITALLDGGQPRIYGDGTQSRDFVYVGDIVDANLLACTASDANGESYNIAAGTETSLLTLVAMLGNLVGRTVEPEFAPQRAGDVHRSSADISAAMAHLGFHPNIGITEGLRLTFEWFREHHTRSITS